MPRLRMRLSHAQPQRHLPIQLRVRQKQIATRIQPVHDGLIRRIVALVPEADQV